MIEPSRSIPADRYQLITGNISNTIESRSKCLEDRIRASEARSKVRTQNTFKTSLQSFKHLDVFRETEVNS